MTSPYVYPGLRFRPSGELEQLLLAVSEALHIPVEALKGRSRRQDVVAARQLYCYVARQRTKRSFDKIGQLVERDHATVLHHVRTCKNRLDVRDPKTIAIINTMEKYMKINLK